MAHRRTVSASHLVFPRRMFGGRWTSRGVGNNGATCSLRLKATDMGALVLAQDGTKIKMDLLCIQRTRMEDPLRVYESREFSDTSIADKSSNLVIA